MSKSDAATEAAANETPPAEAAADADVGAQATEAENDVDQASAAQASSGSDPASPESAPASDAVSAPSADASAETPSEAATERSAEADSPDTSGDAAASDPQPEVAASAEAETTETPAADTDAAGATDSDPEAASLVEVSSVEAAPAEATSADSGGAAESSDAGDGSGDAVAASSDTGSSEAGSSEAGSSETGSSGTGSPGAASSETASSETASSETASSETAASLTGSSETTSPETASPETASSSDTEGAIAPPSPELEAILAAHQRGERVEGRVIGWNKGGFHVVVNGVPAFCPKSQIEIENPKRAAAYVDRTFSFRILEIKDQGKRVVLTRRQALVEDRQNALDRLRQKKASNEPIDGRVTSITDFGAFVDVGGLEGLVHLSQLSRRRVDSAREVVQVGQEVQVKVLKIEKGGDRISLSMKALEPDPWDSVTEKFDTGSEFEGKILRKADFGLFVEVGDGLEGLVHSSNLELGKSLDSVDYAEGNTIKGWVREVDPERKRLSLSLREVAQTNPWSDLKSRYQEGSEVTGRVEQVARFGVFVEIEPGLTGLLPFSSLPDSQGPRPTRQFRPGDSVDVVIDAIDIKRRRISLAPLGSKLEGTKSDYKEYQKKQTTGSGLGALAAAFEKIQR